MEERFDIVDEKGEKTGMKCTRSYAHENGVLHMTTQLFIYRIRQGEIEILLQRRSKNKDTHPGCLEQKQ